MDYDLQEPGANRTGVDLIEKFHIQSRSLLLTYNDSDSRLLDECDQKNIKLLPKILVEKTILLAAPAGKEAIERYDGSVIDDNLVNIINLRKVAKSKGLSLRFYKGAAEFLKDAQKLDPAKTVLIDSRLENGERGEIHAKTFYDELGFHEIVLNTASASQEFREQYPEGMYWIKDIISRETKVEKIVECFV